MSLTLKAPDRPPLAVGVKVTLTLQLWPGARVLSRAPQVFVCVKSPLALIPEIFKVWVPVFVTVTLCGELEPPTVTLPKERLEGVKVTAVADVTPLPLTSMTCGLPEALSVMLNCPVSTPSEEGVNVMSIVQDPPLAASVPTQLSVSAKSVFPVLSVSAKVILEIVRGAVPSSTTITDWTELLTLKV